MTTCVVMIAQYITFSMTTCVVMIAVNWLKMIPLGYQRCIVLLSQVKAHLIYPIWLHFDDGLSLLSLYSYKEVDKDVICLTIRMSDDFSVIVTSWRYSDDPFLSRKLLARNLLTRRCPSWDL